MDRKKYSYRFSELANDDLLGIFDYISYELYSPQAASNLIDRIEEQIERLCDFPLSCALVQDTVLRAKGYRRLVVNNFNIFYLVEDHLIIIERVLYGKRSYENLL